MNDAIDLSDDVDDATPRGGPRRAWTPLQVAVTWAAGWSAFVLAMAALVSAQKGVPLRYTLTSEALNYYTLAIISVIVWMVGARMDSNGWSRARQAVAHGLLGVVLVAGWQTLYWFYLSVAAGSQVWRLVFRTSWMFQAMNACVLYAGVVAGVVALLAARRARELERRRHEAALLARDAELRVLTAQLEPHFLLNTLTSVLALVEESPADARAMLERLAHLLRGAFDEMRETEVTLGRELDLIAAYLGIERVRFADRLSVNVDVPSSLRDVVVPPFLLQPLVENAIKHAVSRCNGSTDITIRGRREDGVVRLEVADSGPGFTPDDSSRGGGLRLTEQRLRAFAPGAQLRVTRGIASGCVVALSFPE